MLSRRSAISGLIAGGVVYMFLHDPVFWAQTLAPDKPAKEYVYAGGRLLSIENYCLIAPPTPNSPTGETSSPNPAFSWAAPPGAVPGTTNYWVAYAPVPAFYTGNVVPTVLGPTTATSISGSGVADGDYAWVVAGGDTNGYGCVSEARLFTIFPTVPGCPLAVPTQLSPNSTTPPITNPVTFSWAAVDRASLYVVMVGDSTEKPVLARLVTGTQLVSTATFAPGTYFWIVMSYNSSCGASDPAVGFFQI